MARGSGARALWMRIGVAAAAAAVLAGAATQGQAEPDGTAPAQPQLICVITPAAFAGGVIAPLPEPGAVTRGGAALPAPGGVAPIGTPASAPPAGMAPVAITSRPPAVAPVQSTVGPGAPSTGLPDTVVLTPQPGNRAYVVSTATTQPSLPGVTLVAPQVLVPPNAAPGQVPSLVAAGLLQGLQRPAKPSAPAPVAICFNVR